jgi:hypothetical protein
MVECEDKRVEEEYGGCIANVDSSDPNLFSARKKCRDKYSAIVFIEHVTKGMPICKSVRKRPPQKMANEYPDTLTHAAEILNKGKTSKSRGRISGDSHVFLQQFDRHDSRETDRGGNGGRRSGRGRGGCDGGRSIGSGC